MFKPSELPFRRKTWVDLAAIPMNRRGWELSDCTDVTQDVLDRLGQWIKAAKDGKIILAEGSKACGRGLLLYGASGHGKSTLALAVLQQVIKDFPIEVFGVKPSGTLVRPAYFIQYPTLVDLRGTLMDDPTANEVRLWEGIMGECKEDAYNVRVLVIDDVRREHRSGTEWSRNLLHQVLRTRYSNGLPTIITSNHSLDKWGNLYGDHTESFAQEAFMPLEIKSPGGDLRK